jgi:hypothetical protein
MFEYLCLACFNPRIAVAEVVQTLFLYKKSCLSGLRIPPSTLRYAFSPPPKNMGGYPIRKAALIPPSSASVTISPSSTSVTIPSSSASETTPSSSASTTTRTIPKDLYGFHFDRFVEDKSNFLPQDGHRTIEIEESADGSKLSLSEKEILESEISSWLHQVSIASLD